MLCMYTCIKALEFAIWWTLKRRRRNIHTMHASLSRLQTSAPRIHRAIDGPHERWWSTKLSAWRIIICLDQYLFYHHMPYHYFFPISHLSCSGKFNHLSNQSNQKKSNKEQMTYFPYDRTDNNSSKTNKWKDKWLVGQLMEKMMAAQAW